MNTNMSAKGGSAFGGKKYLFIIAGLFLLSAACNKQQTQVQPVQNQSAQTSESVQQQSQATSTDETASWKTYSNAQYGFTFQYPSETKLFIYTTSSDPSILLNIWVGNSQ